MRFQIKNLYQIINEEKQTNAIVVNVHIKKCNRNWIGLIGKNKDAAI